MTDNRTSIEIAKEIAALALKHREATVSVPVGVEYQKPKHFFVGLTILIDLAASNSQPPKLDGSPQYAVCNQKTRDKCIAAVKKLRTILPFRKGRVSSDQMINGLDEAISLLEGDVFTVITEYLGREIHAKGMGGYKRNVEQTADDLLKNPGERVNKFKAAFEILLPLIKEFHGTLKKELELGIQVIGIPKDELPSARIERSESATRSFGDFGQGITFSGDPALGE